MLLDSEMCCTVTKYIGVFPHHMTFWLTVVTISFTVIRGDMLEEKCFIRNLFAKVIMFKYMTVLTLWPFSEFMKI